MKTCLWKGLGIFLLAILCQVGTLAQNADHDCAVDQEYKVMPIVPSCAVQNVHGQVQVAKSHLAKLSFNKYGLAAALLPEIGWTYVNRSGFVVVRNVAVMDNGANEFHQGLVRVTAGGRWGLADTHGKLVVPLEYDGALDYDSSRGWQVCKGCHTVDDGEHSFFKGGKWFRLNAQGKVVGSAKQP